MGRVPRLEAAAIRATVCGSMPPFADQPEPCPPGPRDDDWHPLVDGRPPPWACAWGEDAFGIYARFAVGGAESRMRWVRPGTFRMGSPEGEYGRTRSEGPQHAVTLSRGYWLADVPVTQALWERVMDENPSRFKSPWRPVEAVSWEDCQRFIGRLNTAIPGLLARLPSEAEWEYACRGGTSTSTYAGDLDERTAGEVLASIAWYAANCGRETHDVAQKQANAWGLHDMLGSVWEWCADGMRTYGPEAQVDPLGPATPTSPRVYRGGSWGNNSASVRAARRRDARPGVRDDLIGLRLAADHADAADSAGSSGSGLRPRN